MKKVQAILNDYLWNFDPLFIPEDSYLLIGQVLTGDLCEVEALQRIEKDFRLKINPDDGVIEGTMLDMALYIENKKQNQ